MLRYASQFEEAELLLSELYEARNAKYGKHAPKTLVPLRELVEMRLDANRAGDAVDAARLWTQLVSEQESPDEALQAWAQTALAEALLEADKPREAAETIDESLLNQEDEAQRHRALSVWAAAQGSVDYQDKVMKAAEWFDEHLSEMHNRTRSYAPRAAIRAAQGYHREGHTDKEAVWQERVADLVARMKRLANGTTPERGEESDP